MQVTDSKLLANSVPRVGGWTFCRTGPSPAQRWVSQEISEGEKENKKKKTGAVNVMQSITLFSRETEEAGLVRFSIDYRDILLGPSGAIVTWTAGLP